MKFVPFFIFLVLIDLYFYFGTVTSVNKLAGNISFYKIFYWFLSVIIYSAIIYVIVTYEKTANSTGFNNTITSNFNYYHSVYLRHEKNSKY